MTNNHSTATAEAEPSSAETQTRMSDLDFAYSRLGQNPQSEQEETQVQPEAENTEDNTESEDVASESGEITEEEKTEDQSEDVLSQSNLDKLLDGLSEEDFNALKEKLGSRAVERFSELTYRAKSAEEKLAEFQKTLESSKDPLEPTTEIKDNPYSDISDISGLQEKAQEVNNVIEWAEDLLFKSDEYGPSDVVTEIEGKEFTKSDVRESLRNARKSRDKFLPAQLQVIQSVEKGKQLEEAFAKQAKNELSWMSEESSETKGQYEAMVSDPRFKELKEKLDPELGAQLNYLIAHAANSLYGRKIIKEEATTQPKSIKLDPPSGPSRNSPNPEKGVSSVAKALKEQSKRLEQTRSQNDWINLRTLQLSKK